MKKSSLLQSLKKKTENFNKGKNLLETEIEKSPGEIEFRFLRFIIQENAPPIVHYRKNMEEDRELIYSSFASLPSHLQNEIISYATHSKLLNLETLNKLK
jgi:hypothetical protein